MVAQLHADKVPGFVSMLICSLQAYLAAHGMLEAVVCVQRQTSAPNLGAVVLLMYVTFPRS